MEKNKDSVKWINDLSISTKLDTTIQTLQYMLARNSYNAPQSEALDIALTTLEYIKKLNK